MTSLLPYCDLTSLQNLSQTNKQWHNIVKTYLRDFNKVIQADVPRNDNQMLKFATLGANKLVRLELNWSTSKRESNDILKYLLLSNKGLKEIDITTGRGITGWISTDVVLTIAFELPNLESVCFSTSRIAYYYNENDGKNKDIYRKLWPHPCWRSIVDNRLNYILKYTEKQVASFEIALENIGFFLSNYEYIYTC